MFERLLIIIPDKLTDLVNKGEVTSRYYNPGNLFKEVHILMINDDRPDKRLVQKMVGEAKLYLYNFPEPPGFFKRTLGWRPFLVYPWGKKILPIVQKINPNLVRCHGAHINAFIAFIIKKELNVPYVISLHTNPDESFRGVAKTVKEKIVAHSILAIERIGILNANLVMPVYKSILPYLKKIKAKNIEVCYNVVGENFTKYKKNYSIRSPMKLITIGNLNCNKNPINIIKAVESLNNVELTIIGNGVGKDSLLRYVNENDLNRRISFIESIENKRLADIILLHDVVVLHTNYFEFSKVMIECSLLGMPIITNTLPSGLKVPELQNDNCLFVKDLALGYMQGIELFNIESERKKYGSNAREFAMRFCDPKKCEDKYKKKYENIMSSILME